MPEKSLVDTTLRQAGVIVNDVAVQHTENDHTAHTIVIPDWGHVLHLELTNTQSSLRICRPTEDELNESTGLERVILTEDGNWDPEDPIHNERERIAMKRNDFGHMPGLLVVIFYMWLECYPPQSTY